MTASELDYLWGHTAEKIKVVHKKPLETQEDYNEMLVYIEEVLSRATNKNLKNELLSETGMYKKDGKLKKEVATHV